MISPDHLLVGSYDIRLVVLSVLISVMASYAVLDLAGRVTSARGTVRLLWLGGGATAMGIGIWSMHYVGMLAFRLPIPVLYDWPTVLLSLFAAVLASAIALFVASRREMGLFRAAVGSVFMGQRDRGDALHRHGGHATAGDVPLLSQPGVDFGGVGSRHCIRCAASDLSFSGRNKIGWLAKGFKRGSDGGRGSGDALHRNGGGQFHFLQLNGWQHVACPKHIFGGYREHHCGYVYGPWTHGPYLTD
jgi:hypothetical protein